MTRGRRHPSPGIGRSAVVWNIRPNPSAARLYGVVTVNSQIGQDGRPFDTVLGRVELVSLLSKTGTNLATRVANGGFTCPELEF